MNKKLYVLLGVIVVGILGWVIFKKEIGTINIPSSVGTTDTSTNGSGSLSGFTVPAGFSINIFAKDVPGARVIEIDPKGRVLVSETSEGKVVALDDKNNDGKVDATEQKVLASGLSKPHGLAMHCEAGTCALYVAERDELTRYPYDVDTLTLGAKEKLMDIDSSLTDRHFTRSLLFLPAPNQDTLLVSVGSSCDVCHDSGDHGSIISYNIKTQKKEVYATGLRNATFMTLNPVSGKVFATEMGRDNLGDNIPPDEINIINKGANYGWPNCYGQNIHDTQFDKNTYIRNPCMAPFETPSFVDLPAHSAPLGISFIPEEGWPEQYWYNALVAYHGSWNRSTPTGYKIALVKMNAKGEYLGAEDFVTGWLLGQGSKTGRPADIKVLSGGVAYISDDSSGVVYKLWKN